MEKIVPRMPCQCPECQKINYDAGMKFLATRQKHIKEKDNLFYDYMTEPNINPVENLKLGSIDIQQIGGSEKALSLWSDIEKADADMLKSMYTNAIIENSLPKNVSNT